MYTANRDIYQLQLYNKNKLFIEKFRISMYFLNRIVNTGLDPTWYIFTLKGTVPIEDK